MHIGEKVIPSARVPRRRLCRALDELNRRFGKRVPTRSDASVRYNMLKRVAEYLLVRGGPAALAAWRRRGSTLILAYHNVVPDDAPAAGDRSLHLPLKQFRSHLDTLQETHDVVDLASIHEANRTSDKPRVCITFDDAYRGALALALPELVRRGLPATVFVAPGLLGSDGCWWDLLAAQDGSGLSSDIRDHVLDVLAGDGASAVEWARSQGIPLSVLPGHAGIVTEDELRLAAARTGITFGAHTWSHCNLAEVGYDAFDVELVKPLHWLRERFECVVPWIAYPYGLAATSTSDLARRAGYDGALRIDGGWIPSASAPAYVFPRLNIPAGLSSDGFVLRVRGLLDS